ncbi:hypothetical protein AVEN_27627-1 [Araneus ventricosus]|uniref:Uncharacterized protein n=1 Tax=Araneus ventricosus TaxID=182803 RepID=A0A4Y2EQ03_ARAVE|nr:hypothetical protein AVEN_27627-1 [Araneus ventricosus]
MLWTGRGRQWQFTESFSNCGPIIWRSSINDGTHDIVPRVSNKPVGWNKEEIMFVTGHGPFPSYLHRFNLRTHDNCSCGEKGDPIHYATKCQFTLS